MSSVLQSNELTGLVNTTNPYSPLNVPIRAVAVGLLYSVLVEQTAGNIDGFSVTVYCSSNAAVPNIHAVAGDTIYTPPNSNGSLSADLYRVIDKASVASGTSLLTVFIPNGQPYANVHNTTRDRESYLYLSIVPNSPAANKTFDARVVYRGFSAET